MIPKIIHYCWLSGDPFPENIQRCIDTWKEYLPDYEFMLWNRQRFPQGHSLWVDQAFRSKRYAFAADFIRLYALYNYGGIYLDCDVEVLRTFNPFLHLRNMICWQKDCEGLEVATFGVEPHAAWVKQCLDYYDGRPFVTEKGFYDDLTMPLITERQLRAADYSLVNVATIDEAQAVEGDKTIAVLPSDFFSPKSYRTKETRLTANTVSIHQFEGSWLFIPFYTKIDLFLGRLFHCRFFYLTTALRYVRLLLFRHQ